MTMNLDKSKAVQDWLNSLKSARTRVEYEDRFQDWLEYCKVKGLPLNGNAQLEDMKRRRLSQDQTVKFFYDNEVPKFFKWLTTEYKQKKGRNIGKPLSESSALSSATAIRSFFSYHRYTLEIQKEALPSSEKVKGIYEDHAFDIYQLRAMFQQGDLFERTVLDCGKDLGLRASDFIALERDTIEYLINQEKEKAQQENREPDVIEFEVMTLKEKEPASCHLSHEAIELLTEYLKTYPKKNGHLFPITEEYLTDILRKLFRKAKLTKKPNTRIRWHCLRKFFITVAHGKIREPVLKYMTGKHIGKDLKTYIQENQETKIAFKQLEPLLSLTKSNGNGQQLTKQLEEMKKTTFKQLALMRLMEKITPKEEMAKALEDLAQELGITLKPTKRMKSDSGKFFNEYDFNEALDKISQAIEQADLERVLAENGKNNS